MMRALLLIVAVMLGSALFPVASHGQGTQVDSSEISERQQQAIDVLAKLNLAARPTRNQFVTGSVAFALYHEFGHFLIHEYDIPILGRGQEDMADAYATFELAAYSSIEHMQSAVRLWLYLAFSKGGAPIQWWDEHSLDHQRAFDIACVLTGRWPHRYAGLPEAFGASARRAALCQREAPRRHTAWAETLLTHKAALINRQQARVTYQPAPAALAEAERWLQSNGLLESIAREIERYELPQWRQQWRERINKDIADGRLSVGAYDRSTQRVEVVAKSCGYANAFHLPSDDKPVVPGLLPKGSQPQNPRLTLCYELVDKFRELADLAGLEDPRGQ